LINQNIAPGEGPLQHFITRQCYIQKGGFVIYLRFIPVCFNDDYNQNEHFLEYGERKL
jgi:hypothetical protein